jgi:arsenite methyltransferase
MKNDESEADMDVKPAVRAEEANVKKAVRKGYARIAQSGSSCGCSCDPQAAASVSKSIGYSDEEVSSVPEGSDLGLGCGNPVALASLRPGETVVDLGSGAGFDCFLAAAKVGDRGRVIGVDMTPEMVDKARCNARRGGYSNVEFRLGEIEHLPVPDRTADIVISNCVINLVPDKRQVFRDAFRVLKPGGRLMVSDIVLLAELPAALRDSIAAYVGCLSGASLKHDYLAEIEAAGFTEVKVLEESSFPIEALANDPTAQAVAKELGLDREAAEHIVTTVQSIRVSGTRPRESEGRRR